MITRLCDFACNMIIRYADDLTPARAHLIMTLAHLIDPRESFHAAHIRDTLRDNTDF